MLSVYMRMTAGEVFERNSIGRGRGMTASPFSSKSNGKNTFLTFKNKYYSITLFTKE